MRAGFVLLLSVIVAALAAPAAGASGSPTFAGSCAITGTETFTPPLTVLGHPTTAVVTATGRCTGTLVDGDGTHRSVDAAAATYQQTTVGTATSCAGGTSRGAGVLTIDGVQLPFAVTEPQLTVFSTLSYRAIGWKGSGVASVAPSANPLDLVLACLGRGVGEIPIVLWLSARLT